jgi:hypothetical protein
MPHSSFLQAAIARLLIKGMWFSDALTIIHTVYPTTQLPDDWEDPFYDVTRKICSRSIVPIPNYKPIW